MLSTTPHTPFVFRLSSKEDSIRVEREEASWHEEEEYYNEHSDEFSTEVSFHQIARDKDGSIALDGSTSSRFTLPVDRLALGTVVASDPFYGRMAEPIYSELARMRFAAIYPSIIGMLLAIYQSPRPTLLALEEPEQTIHPGLLRLLVDAVKEASTSMQVLITTHSPHLLDYFPPKTYTCN